MFIYNNTNNKNGFHVILDILLREFAGRVRAVLRQYQSQLFFSRVESWSQTVVNGTFFDD